MLEHWPYLAILAWLLAVGLGLPMPEEIPLLTGGYLCHEEHARIIIMIPICLLGVLTGDFVLFGLGRRFGHRVVEHRWLRKLVRRQRLILAENLFERHGVKILLFGRFLPGLRPMLFVAAGVLKVPVSTFIAVNGCAAAISVPVLVLLGKLFGHNFDQLERGVRTASHLIMLVSLAGLLIALGIYAYIRQRRLMTEAQADAPPTPAEPPPDDRR